MKRVVRYTVAIVGALIVFVGVFFAWGVFVNPWLPAVFSSPMRMGVFVTNNTPGAIVGAIAATSSFRATLRRRI